MNKFDYTNFFDILYTKIYYKANESYWEKEEKYL